MKIEYKLKDGRVLSCYEMMEVYEAYDQMTIASSLIDTYALSDEEAMKKANDVRRIMFKFGYNEEDAILEIMGKAV